MLASLHHLLIQIQIQMGGCESDSLGEASQRLHSSPYQHHHHHPRTLPPTPPAPPPCHGVMRCMALRGFSQSCMAQVARHCRAAAEATPVAPPAPQPSDTRPALAVQRPWLPEAAGYRCSVQWPAAFAAEGGGAAPVPLDPWVCRIRGMPRDRVGSMAWAAAGACHTGMYHQLHHVSTLASVPTLPACVAWQVVGIRHAWGVIG